MPLSQQGSNRRDLRKISTTQTAEIYRKANKAQGKSSAEVKMLKAGLGPASRVTAEQPKESKQETKKHFKSTPYPEFVEELLVYAVMS